MNEYGPKAQKLIEKTMRQYKEGELKSGRGKRPVKNRRQALAIGISKARRHDYKVPNEKN